MNKQKQIEEMAIIIEHACDDCNGIDIDDCLKCPHKRHHEYYGCGEEKTATELYEAGYRMIPEGAVVITEDCYKALVQVYEDWCERCKGVVYEARKETAKELATTIMSVLLEEEKDEKIRIKDVHGVIRDILSAHYGVEVK